MKRICILLFSMLLVLLCACSAPEEQPIYTIYRENGKCYLRFADNYSQQLSDAHAEYEAKHGVHSSIAIGFPTFDSVAEMKKAVESCDFHVMDLYPLWEASADGVLEIVDPEDMREITLPKDLSWDYILWSGSRYSFYSKSQTISGHLDCCTEDVYNRLFSENYTNFPDNPKMILSEEFIPERNAQITCFRSTTSKLKTIRYSITPGDCALHIMEMYALSFDSDNSVLIASGDTPQYVDIYAVVGNNYLYGRLYGLKKSPSTDWLSSIGFTVTTN